MKIYTRKGDGGKTGLLDGSRVRKDHPRIVACGSVDELNSVVGWLRSAGLDSDLDKILESVQASLLEIGSELASSRIAKKRTGLLSETDVSKLENVIDGWESGLQPVKKFILPCGTEAAGRAHIFRSVCRRAEREIVSLSEKEKIDPMIIKYLNRLSDLAFVLARVINSRFKCIETFREK